MTVMPIYGRYEARIRGSRIPQPALLSYPDFLVDRGEWCAGELLIAHGRSPVTRFLQGCGANGKDARLS